MSEHRHFVALQGRGLIALPADLRRRHQLDQPGAQVEVRERADGVIELHPLAAVPVDQQWFWTEKWQSMEREAQQQLEGGAERVHQSSEEFLQHLDSLSVDSPNVDSLSGDSLHGE